MDGVERPHSHATDTIDCNLAGVLVMWEYRAHVERVVDGDTLILSLDLGFFLEFKSQRFRLLGVDTPELRGVDKQAGFEAKRFVEEWLRFSPELGTAAVGIRVVTHKPPKTDSFGRWLVTVWRNDDPVSLNDALLAAGQAVKMEAP
jgi:micrococcal nuclease